MGFARANLYAIHGVGTARRHLAMTPVPGEAPDFHRLEYFARLPGCPAVESIASLDPIEAVEIA